jgi:uncharacterized membrane protein
VLAFLAAVAYAAISIYRHDHFASNAFDLGVQDQTVWGYSQLQIIPNTVAMIRNLLGDHFHPILMTAAPFYWIWDDARVLLIIQAALLGSASIPIFLWARQRLGLVAAIAFQASYLVFWGVLAGVVFDFHHIVFAVAALSFALYAVLTRNNPLFWAMLAVGLLSRENVALTFAAVGVYIGLVQRRWRLGVAVTAVSLAWFTVLIEVIMPAIAGVPYGHWTYEALGTGPGSALLHVIRHPIDSLKLLFIPVKKVRIWLALFGPWLFLPLLSPLVLVAIPSLADRFWSSNPLLWTTRFHYSLLIAPILAFAAIDSLERIQRFVPGFVSWARSLVPPAGALAVLLASGVSTFVLVTPLDELATYIPSAQVAQVQSCLDVIPPRASVSASNFLLPHLSHRRDIYLLNLKTDTEYIAIDLATYRGHFYPGEEQQVRTTIQTALASGYGVACSAGTTVVLQRGAGNQSVSPEITGFLQQKTGS